MRELGVAAEKGKRKCRVTGLTVIEWDVTSRLPKTPEREVSICPTCGHKQIIAN
jgi:hypothetical protein